MIQRLLRALVRHLPPPRVIYDRDGGSPYLSRYYLVGRLKDEDIESEGPMKGQLRRGVVFPTTRLGVYLHKFHRGDDDLELHNHPWRWAVSFILAGGYREERRVRGTDNVETRVLRAGSLNILRADDYHRVELLEGEAWSLFVVGPKVSDWSFWNRQTGRVTQWRKFIERKRATCRVSVVCSPFGRTRSCGAPAPRYYFAQYKTYVVGPRAEIPVCQEHAKAERAYDYNMTLHDRDQEAVS